MSLCTLNGDQKLSLSEFPNLSIIMVFFRKTAYESKQEYCYPFLFLFFLITFLSCFKKIWPDSFFPHHAMFSFLWVLHTCTNICFGYIHEKQRTVYNLLNGKSGSFCTCVCHFADVDLDHISCLWGGVWFLHSKYFVVTT